MLKTTWKQRLLCLIGIFQYVHLATADVYIMTSAYILDPLPDIPADFGPDIPDAGIEGVLRPADPEDACSPFTFTDFGTPWIALIARQQQLHPNNCTFDIKVMNAQNAGAIAAIVYDDVYESLIIMSKPKGHPDPDIPAVFVSQKAGIIMRKLMTIDTIRVRITPMSSVAWLSMLMSAFLGVLALGVVLATFYVMRSWSMWLTGMHVRGGGGPGAGAPAQAGHGRPAGGPAQEHGLDAESLRLLPVLVFEPSVSSRASRPASGPASAAGTAAATRTGAGALSTASSQPGSLSREGAAAVGAAVWAAEDEEAAAGYEELRPLLLGGEGEGEDEGGDVEEGCGRLGGFGDEEEEELASRSSSEGGCGAAAAAAARLSRPPGAHAGETKRVCAICLESYVEGEKIRVLPCAHRFHMGCVDQWLANRRYCPVCKHDASQPLPHAPASSRGGGGAAEAGSGRAAAGGSMNGWTLLFQGLVDLIRHPRVVPRQQPAASQPRQQRLRQQPQQRARGRRHQQQQLLLPSPRAAAAAAELLEPLVPPAATPQPSAAAAPSPSSAPPPAGDLEAPGPSQPPIAAAAAAAPATGSSISSARSGVPSGAASSGASMPISIPANAGALAAATAEPAAGQQRQQRQQQAGRAAAAAAGGPAARVRAVLAGLWGSAAGGGGGAAAGTPQYSSTL